MSIASRVRRVKPSGAATKTTRAAARVLDVLIAINRLGQATLTEVSVATGLSTATTLRLLRTLQDNEFVTRGAHDCYRSAAKVRQLSSGYDDEAWITDCARPHLLELGESLRWPVSLAVPCGVRMLVCENTDASSPLAIRRYPTGFTVPMLRSASGLAYLASCNAIQRDMLLEVLNSTEDPEEATTLDPVQLRQLLELIAKVGYAFYHMPRRVSDLTTFAVPLTWSQRAVGCIAVRFARAAVDEQEATRNFLPQIRETVSRITGDLTVIHAEVCA